MIKQPSIFLLLLFITIASSAAEKECYDTDKSFVISRGAGIYTEPGIDRYIKGDVTYEKKVYTDYCVNIDNDEPRDEVGFTILEEGHYVMEQTCLDGVKYYEDIYQCPGGCKKGACIEEGYSLYFDECFGDTQEVCAIKDNNPATYANNCYAKKFNATVTFESPCPINNCEDSDNTKLLFSNQTVEFEKGEDLYIKGNTTFEGSSHPDYCINYEGQNLTEISIDSEVESGDHVVENTCLFFHGMSKHIYKCEDGCFNGKCKKEREITISVSGAASSTKQLQVTDEFGNVVVPKQAKNSGYEIYDLIDGNYEIEAKAKKHHPYKKEIQIPSGEDRIHISLIPIAKSNFFSAQSCKDSDDKSFTTKGYINGTVYDTQTGHEDFCVGLKNSFASKQEECENCGVFEYWCEENKGVGKMYKCSHCKDGACLGETKTGWWIDTIDWMKALFS